MFGPKLHPHRALLHPLWIAALILLAVNDHALKGAGIVPGALTGKLSDFAGLLVAPALLATVCRIRTQRGWALSHVAVGVVFAAIQLSTSAADGWSALMGLVGAPWTIYSDPTDLLALPVLLVSFSFFPRAMARSVAGNARRVGEWAAAAGGLFCCVATSREPADTFVPEITADVYVVNETDDDLVVLVRDVAVTVDFDCDEMARDPGRLFTEALFGQAQAWTVAAGRSMTVLGNVPRDRECYAALIEADNFAPAVAFWFDGQPPMTITSGEGREGPGWIALQLDDGRSRYESDRDLVHPLVSAWPAEGACVPQLDASRIAWDDDVPTGDWVLQNLDFGVDGCLGLDLSTGFQAQQGVVGRRWYLCLMGGAFPFAAGDRISVEPLWSTTGSGSGVKIVELDAQTGSAAMPAVELVASRGAGTASPFGMTLALTPQFDCGFSAEPECGTVARSATVTAGGGGFESGSLGVRETLKVQNAVGDEVELFLGYAQERIAVDPECAEGPDALGGDLEIVAVLRGGASGEE